MRTITITDLQRKASATIEYITSATEPVIMRRPKGGHIAIEAVSACNRRLATIKWLSDPSEVKFILDSLADVADRRFRTFQKINLIYHVTETCMDKYLNWQKSNSTEVRRMMLRASKPKSHSAIPLMGVLEGCCSLAPAFEQPSVILFCHGPGGPLLLDHLPAPGSGGQSAVR